MYLVILLSPVLWLLRVAILLVFAIPGVPLIAMLAYGRVYRVRFTPQFGRDLLLFPAAFGLWNNLEDGIDGLRGGDPAQFWWRDKTAGWSDARRVFIWSAFRNPVDSLRFMPILNPKLDPLRVRHIGMDREPYDGESGWYFAWQGVYSCVQVEFRVFPNLVWTLRLVARLFGGIDLAMVMRNPAEAILLARAPIDARPVYMKFWLGWKFHPDDPQGLQPGDARAIACDFAAQFKRVA